MTLPITNYVNEYLDEFKPTDASKAALMPKTVIRLKAFNNLLKHATRFVIPDGMQFSEGVRVPTASDFETFNLPYPIVALEFSSYFEGVMHDFIVVLVKSDNPYLTHCMSQDLIEEAQGLIKEKPLLVITAFRFGKGWACNSEFVIIPIDQFNLSKDFFKYEDEFTDTNWNDTEQERENAITLLFHPFLTEIWNSLMQLPDKKLYKMSVDYALVGARAGLLFLSACCCSNVMVEVHKPNVPLNKSRKKAGKLPFFDYHYLKVKHGECRVNVDKVENEESHRKSPRFHTRRGHTRRGPKSGKPFWVMPHVVGSTANGVIVKDYLWL